VKQLKPALFCSLFVLTDRETASDDSVTERSERIRIVDCYARKFMKRKWIQSTEIRFSRQKYGTHIIITAEIFGLKTFLSGQSERSWHTQCV